MIPDSVESIGSSAFYCSGLTSVTIGNGVTNIGYDAFRGCSELTSIVIPDSVESIGNYAFLSCSGLTSITVDENNENYYSENNCLIERSDGTLIQGCRNSVIPDSVTSIGNYAFAGCSGLTSIVIPDSVTNIGYFAFYNCNGLTSVTIGKGVKSIGDCAFWSCSGLTDIYYAGTKTEWNAISKYALIPSNATIHYNYKA